MNKIWPALIAVILVALPSNAYAAPPDTLIGHRGLGSHWQVEYNIPENSIPAIQWAANNGADMVEGDCQVTRDGRHVVMHDDRLERTTNGTGYVKDRDLSYITGRYLELPIDRDGSATDPLDGDNTIYRPPTCKQWMTAAKDTGKLVFMELKAGERWSRTEVKEYVDMVNSLGMKDKVITAGSETKISYLKSYGFSRVSLSAQSKPSLSKIKSVVGSNGYATISISTADADASYVETLYNGGIKVIVYTLNDVPHYEWAIGRPFWAWMCDNSLQASDWLADWLAANP